MSEMSGYFEKMSGVFDFCVKYSPYLEMSIGLPCILFNVYLAARFSAVQTLNKNFRVLMVSVISERECHKSENVFTIKLLQLKK